MTRGAITREALKKAQEEYEIKLPGEVRFTTEKAFLFFYSDKKIVWLPKSCCKWDRKSKIMTMPKWLAEQKELI